MSDNEEYLQETKAITDCFYALASMLRNRRYTNATYFLDVAFVAYSQHVERELEEDKSL